MTKSTSKLFESETPEEMKEDAMNLPEEVEEQVVEETIPEESTDVIETPPIADDDIQDVDISAIKKKKFRVNGDPNKIIELNTSDLNITNRLTLAYNRLVKYMDKVGEVLEGIPDNSDDMTEEQRIIAEEKLQEIDDNMKAELDYIFDSPISEACSDGGSMYDPFDGAFRYEHIIESLSKLYETNLSREFALMRKRVSAKTSKYTKKYHK